MAQSLEEFLKTVDKSKFKNTPFIKRVEKPWGYELHFTPTDALYTGKILHISAGKQLSMQIHDKKQESYYLASGECNLIIENTEGELETVKMEHGKGYTVLVGQRHRHQAITDCDVFEASMSELGSTTYRLEDDYKRPNEDDELRKDPNRGWNS